VVDAVPPAAGAGGDVRVPAATRPLPAAPRPQYEALRPRSLRPRGNTVNAARPTEQPTEPFKEVLRPKERVVTRETLRRLVCRWVVEKSRTKTKTPDAANNYYARGEMVTAAAEPETLDDPDDPPSPSKMLSEPDEGDGRRAMAAPFKSWYLLRLSLCREVMAELMSGKKSSSSSTSSARNGSSRAKAARLINVMGDMEEGGGGGSGDNYHEEDALPPCDGHTRVDALVAVSRDSWGSSAEVADCLVRHLPGSDGSLLRPRILRPRGGAGDSKDGVEEDEEKTRTLDNHDNFTVVRVVSRDLEVALRLSPFPKAYPASFARAGLDDGFYSSYRQFCALSQRASEIAESSTSAFESIGESFAGRDIYALRVFGGSTAPERRVLVLGGQHAREWWEERRGMQLTHSLKAPGFNS
jgi:hypothetical protein